MLKSSKSIIYQIFIIFYICVSSSCFLNNQSTENRQIAAQKTVDSLLFRDTLLTVPHVYDSTGKLFAIDKHGKPLFEIYIYDNGADYVEEGLFRMKKNNKVGFADTNNTIIIAPEYDFASPFKNGKSVVCNGCKKDDDFAYSGGKWGVIDKKGVLYCL